MPWESTTCAFWAPRAEATAPTQHAPQYRGRPAEVWRGPVHHQPVAWTSQPNDHQPVCHARSFPSGDNGEVRHTVTRRASKCSSTDEIRVAEGSSSCVSPSKPWPWDQRRTSRW
jgi:hypothetical protein